MRMVNLKFYGNSRLIKVKQLNLGAICGKTRYFKF